MKGLGVLFLLLTGGCVMVNARPAVDADSPVASENGFNILDTVAVWVNDMIHQYRSVNFDEDATTTTTVPTYQLKPEDVAWVFSHVTQDREMLADAARADVQPCQHPVSDSMLSAATEDGRRLADFDCFKNLTGYADNTTTAAATLPTTTTEEPAPTEEPPTTTTTAETTTTRALSEELGNFTPSPEEIRRKEMMKLVTNLEHLSVIERKLEKAKQAESSKEESYLSSLTSTLKEAFTSFWPYLPICVFLIVVVACLTACVKRRRNRKAHDLKHDLDAFGFPNKEVVI